MLKLRQAITKPYSFKTTAHAPESIASLLKRFLRVEIRSLIFGKSQCMWSALSFTILGMVPPYSAPHTTWRAFDIKTRLLQYVPARVAAKAHVLLAAGCWRQPSNRWETWQRDPDFWVFCLFFWVFHMIQIKVIIHINWLFIPIH